MRFRPYSLALTLAFSAGGSPVLFGARPAQAALQTATLDDLVLASVSGEEITRRMLVTRLIEYQGEDALNRMVNRVLVDQSAKRMNLSVTEDELVKRLVQIRSQFKGEAAYQEFLKRSALTEEQHKDEVRFTLLMQKVALKEAPIADADLQQFDIRMIVSKDKATAEQLVKDLENGADFARTASEKTTDPAGRKAGGRMAPFIKIEMMDVAKGIEDQKLIPGSFTRQPVLLGNDTWVIIKLERLLPVASASTPERDRLTQLMTRYRMDQWLNAVHAKAEIKKSPLTEEVVARVNGEPISRAQLAARLLSYHGEQTLTQMINRTLLLQSAKRLGVSVSEAEADKQLADFKARFKSPDDYQALLTRNSLTERQLRDEFRYTVLMEKVALKETPISDEDLMQYDIRMMEAPSQATAEKWIKDLDGGTDFERMARERSLDPQGRQSGGKMRPFLKVEALEIWRNLNEQKVKAGGYTKKPVLLADNSWVILKLEALLPPTMENRDQLKEVVTNYRVNQWLNQTFSAAESSGKIARPVPLTQAVIQGTAANR